MASAPVVQNLNDLIAQYTQAQAPQQQALDTSIATNQQTGDAQKSGIDAAKAGAFGGITQQANNRGMFFSGFTPDAEAKYTGSTYLPALAKLQTAIANTRDTLLGKKADLTTQANTQAINTQKQQQAALDAYNMELQREEQARQLAAQQQAFQARENAANRAAAASRASSAPAKFNAAELLTAVRQHVAGQLSGSTGRDGKVSPATWAAAFNDFTTAGGTSRQFWQNYGQYAKKGYAGYAAR